MKYDPQKHHRRSIRLKGYDYSQPGQYFVTLCVQDRLCLFGAIANGQLQLNAAGRMVEKWYAELPNKFPHVQCGPHITMPNHFHAIIEITAEPKTAATNDVNVGADLRVCPDDPPRVCPDDPRVCPDDPPRVCPDDPGRLGEHTQPTLGEHTGSPLHRVVQWFKTMTTNEYIRGVKTNGWPRFNKKLWQRNYWEHIIRNEESYHRIAEYIQDNPARWHEDQLFKP